MINFRFHIVSLIAIFLALALGVVVGAGVIDRGVVDTLNSSLERIEAKSDRIQLENDFLRAALERDRAAIESMQPYVVAGTLVADQVAIVAIRGIDDARVGKTIDAARQAGATVTGVLWIEAKWGLPGDDAKALATVVNEPSLRSSKLRSAAWKTLAARLAKPPLASDATPDLLTTLQDAGFVGYDQLDGGLAITAFPGRTALFVLVVGEDGDIPNDSMVMPAATAFSNESLALVVADVYADLEIGPARGDVFDELRDSELSRTISTVDDLDLAQGPLTIVLALADLTCFPPVVGHYGYGSDTRPIPDPATTCPPVATPATAR